MASQRQAFVHDDLRIARKQMNDEEFEKHVKEVRAIYLKQVTKEFVAVYWSLIPGIKTFFEEESLRSCQKCQEELRKIFDKKYREVLQKKLENLRQP